MLTTVTLLGLLVATAAAFAITEHLKLIKSPLYGTLVSKTLSPVCKCPNRTARVRIRLRRADEVTVTIVDASGDTVATIASGVRLSARSPHRWEWDGTTDTGGRAPDGVYYPWINLKNARRTFRLPNKIVLDTKPPNVLSASTVKPRHVLLAGPGRTVAIRYAFSKPAHALVYLGSRLIIRGRRTRPHDKIKWAGTRGGVAVPAGRYVLSVGAQDLVGNVTPLSGRKDVTVEVRYVQLTPERIAVRSGGRFSVVVRTAARRYAWRLGRRRGSHRGEVLRLRAPTTPGTYRLVVTESGQSTTATVKVRAR